MPAHVDLAKLAEMTAPARTFLTVYLAGPGSVEGLDRRFRRVRRALKGGGPEKDEREHFDANVEAVQDYLARHPLGSGALCLFSCWVLDFFQAVPLAAPVEDLVRIDASPYLRPLAEFEDEYETAAVVVADNAKARIFLVASAAAGPESVIKGNIKNHVRKGGWSQQRYERRRDKQLLEYARDIVEAVVRLDKEKTFRRIVLVGGKEILRLVHQHLPHALQHKVAEKAIDLGRGEGAVNQDILDVFLAQERQSERDLWERIRAEYLRGGLGVVGLDDVLAAAKTGRVDAMIVNRAFKPEGRQCRDCGNLDLGAVPACPACGSASLFPTGLVNAVVELVTRAGGQVDFADPIPTLVEAGEIGALLRY